METDSGHTHILTYRRSSIKQNVTTTPPRQVQEQLYDDPDKMDNPGYGNYELTNCPAYYNVSETEASTSDYEELN